MKKLILLLLLVFSFSLYAAKTNVHIQTWQTKNGVRVLFVAAPQIPMLDMEVLFRVGSVDDANDYGLATLTNAMLNEGAGKYNVDQLNDRFNDIGAQFNNGVDKESSVLAVRTLVKPKLLQQAVQTLNLILTKPTFPKASIDRIKQQMLVGLQAAKQTPDYFAGRAFAKAIWGTHPYANPTNGTEKTIPLLTRAKVAQFYQQYYVAKNALIVMVGDLSTAEAKRVANNIVVGLPKGEVAKPVSPIANNQAVEQHIDFPSTQSTILVGELGIKRDSPNYFPLSVGNYIFGGQSLTSILMSNVREKYGLTYGVYSQFAPLVQRGAFMISLKSRNDMAKRAENMVQDYLVNYLASGPTTDQLKAAKQYLLNSFPLSISNNMAILQNVANIGFYNLPLNYLDTYRENINNVTATQIKDAFNQSIDLQRLVIISVGGKQA